MIRLQTIKSSKWLIERLNKSNNHLHGKIIAIFDNSILIEFSNLGLIHLTQKGDNLSPFSIKINSFDPEWFSIDQYFGFINNYFFTEKVQINLIENIKTYNQSEIKRINNKPPIIKPEISIQSFYIKDFNSLRIKIINSLSDNDNENLINAVTNIIGLGEGLTPSGDDYLIGLLYGLYMNNLTDLIYKLKTSTLPHLDELTNKISKKFIEHALKGQFSENIVTHNWENLLNYGYTSGYFTYLGIYDSLNADKHTLLTT